MLTNNDSVRSPVNNRSSLLTARSSDPANDASLTSTEKLLAARTGLQRWLGASDISPVSERQADNESRPLSLGDSGPAVGTLQQKLADLGFDPGGVDNAFGPNTLNALQQFQQSRIDSLQETIDSGPPPQARSRLQSIQNDLRFELQQGVAGQQTFQQLSIEPASVPQAVEQEPGQTANTDFPDSISSQSSEADVRRLQRSLRISGEELDIDGDFGPQTANALDNYQSEQIAQLDDLLRSPLPPRERDNFSNQRQQLSAEREAGVAGPQTLSSLRAEALRVEGPIDFSEVDPDGILLDERMNPVFVEKLRAVLTDLVEQGFSPEIFEGYRSFDRQESLFAQGRSRGGDIVTNARGGQSWHQYGLAVDIVHQGADKWRESDLWSALGEAGERQGLYWGGNFGDRPHLEFHPGRTPGQAGTLASIFDDRVASQSELEAIWQQLGI